MKRHILPLQGISCLMLLLGGCAALPLPVTVPIETDTVVSGGTLAERMVSDLQFSEYTALDIAQTEAFQNSYVGKEHIVNARVGVLKLTVLSPAAANFDFLQEMSFFVESDGLPRKRIATKTVPRGAIQLTFDLDDTDLTPYIKADQMSITTEVRGNRPPQDTTIRSRLVIRLQAALM